MLGGKGLSGCGYPQLSPNGMFVLSSTCIELTLKAGPLE